MADYDSLGHTEVVGMTVPSKSVGDFAFEYFSLFGSDSERPAKVIHAIVFILFFVHFIEQRHSTKCTSISG